MRLQTFPLDRELQLPWRQRGPDTFVGEDGRIRWLVHPPVVRRRADSGALLTQQEVAWAATSSGDGVVLRSAAAAELDVLEVDAAVAAALDAEPPPIVVPGSFVPLGGVRGLSRFLVGDVIFDTNVLNGRRYASEQTALGIYRIARCRGGPVWDAVATLVADVVARRVSRERALVHDAYGFGETHTRFLADAALLLLAAPGYDTEARRALRWLDDLRVEWGGGDWYLHDTAERDRGANELVLNTHVHALVASLAGGNDIAAGMRALRRALTLAPETSRRAYVLAMALFAGDTLRGRRGPAGRAGHELAVRAQHSAARSRARVPHLRLPGGWLARDVMSSPSPAYLTVNLADLAVLARNVADDVVSQTMHAGLRWARASGFFRAQRLAGDPLSLLVPGLLRNAGDGRAAVRAARDLEDAGWHAVIGWPDHVDHLWPRLVAGTP
jgi:hypothetical protein